jgi:tRNA-uridine 2-sulfurtransferase
VKIMVAMSGGVDSSVAAALLLDQGHEVTGVTLKLWDGPSDTGCCSIADVDDARRVAMQLGIDYHVANMSDAFHEHVVDPYVESHRLGQTPNPCIECNRHLKFGSLLAMADRLGFDALATGHHARIRRTGSRVDLVRGVDVGKDQSYVLSMLSEAQLARIELPVGEFSKRDVRAIAEEKGLRTFEKPDSQEVCFIQRDEGRRGFLAARGQITPGDVVDASSGEVVGHVDALELITLGQKQGLGVDARGEKRVAIRVDLPRRRVEVTSLERSRVWEVPLLEESITWVHEPLSKEGTPVIAQLRAHAEPVACSFEGNRLVFAEPINPIAPGQTAAFYGVESPDVVVGSALVAS